jgi:transaldolase / glucose-6-phosphate isomerase
VFTNPTDVGGRFSALSLFGMVPAALAGIDVARLWERGAMMHRHCVDTTEPAANAGAQLAAFMGGLARRGRDKLTLLTSPQLTSLGDWVEQLVAESTGKESKGIVPVRSGGEPLDVRLTDPYELGQEFFRWEFGTAVAGSLLGINPFDQPDVQAAKDRTNALLSETRPVPGTGPGPEGDIDALLAQAGPGSYVAILAFIDPARERELEPLVRRAEATGAAVAVGLGPRYLHSTGQLHKGGPPTVVALQLVDEPVRRIDIPDRPYDFATLVRAQAVGDLQALESHGRRVTQARVDAADFDALVARVEAALR